MAGSRADQYPPQNRPSDPKRKQLEVAQQTLDDAQRRAEMAGSHAEEAGSQAAEALARLDGLTAQLNRSNRPTGPTGAPCQSEKRTEQRTRIPS